MKNSFRVFGFNNKLFLWGADTWTCRPLGKGELESDNQGRSRDTSFSQETVRGKVQWRPRIGRQPTLLKVQDARRFLTHLPFFLFLENQGRPSRSPNSKSLIGSLL